MKSLFMPCRQNAGQDCNVKTANESLENVAKFKHLGTIFGIYPFVSEKVQEVYNISRTTLYPKVSGLN
jgi:hypothetical protein